jgi:hypothetical protein
MRLDRDTLLQWYKTSADQFEAIVHGFLVRVKGTPPLFRLLKPHTPHSIF